MLTLIIHFTWYDTIGSLTNLTSLLLNGNRLTHLDPKIFEGLSELFELSLSRNQLTSLDSQIFKGLTKISSLFLTGNQLTAIDARTFRGMDYLQFWQSTNDYSAEYVEFVEIVVLSQFGKQSDCLSSIDRFSWTN